jgi:hypothetical protein
MCSGYVPRGMVHGFRDLPPCELMVDERVPIDYDIGLAAKRIGL